MLLALKTEKGNGNLKKKRPSLEFRAEDSADLH